MMFRSAIKEYGRLRYEYKCPHCSFVNIRYEKCGRIVCSFCGKEFNT